MGFRRQISRIGDVLIDILRATRYDVVQIQNARLVKTHATGLTFGQARSQRDTVNAVLFQAKTLAPSGPQDAHAEIWETGSY